jgi:hypothetical protein
MRREEVVFQAVTGAKGGGVFVLKTCLFPRERCSGRLAGFLVHHDWLRHTLEMLASALIADLPKY